MLPSQAGRCCRAGSNLEICPKADPRLYRNSVRRRPRFVLALQQLCVLQAAAVPSGRVSNSTSRWRAVCKFSAYYFRKPDRLPCQCCQGLKELGGAVDRSQGRHGRNRQIPSSSRLPVSVLQMDGGLRQQPGLACEPCRRRKARCDRARPRCGTCAMNGTECVVVEGRPQRGPKKGQLKALRSRVGEHHTSRRDGPMLTCRGTNHSQPCWSAKYRTKASLAKTSRW